MWKGWRTVWLASISRSSFGSMKLSAETSISSLSIPTVGFGMVFARVTSPVVFPCWSISYSIDYSWTRVRSVVVSDGICWRFTISGKGISRLSVVPCIRRVVGDAISRAVESFGLVNTELSNDWPPTCSFVGESKPELLRSEKRLRKLLCIIGFDIDVRDRLCCLIDAATSGSLRF